METAKRPALPLVLHFGPAAGSLGGMAAVLEEYRRLPLSGHRFEFVGTWHPDEPLWSARLFARALAVLAGRSLPRHRPAVVHVHLADGGSLLREGMIARISARLGHPVVVSLHAGDFPLFLRRHGRLCQPVLHRAAVILALGPVMAEQLAALVPLGTRLEIVPNTTPVPDAVSPAGDQPPVALFAARLSRGKGLDVLLAAWPRVHARLPMSELLIVGSPLDIEPVTLPGVRWLGEVPREEVWSLMEMVRVVVLPSRREVMPMALMEAMARARPIVTTPVGEIPALVRDGGVLLDVGDRESLEAALLNLLSDPRAASGLGHRGRAIIEERFSPQQVGARLERLYDEVVTSR